MQLKDIRATDNDKKKKFKINTKYNKSSPLIKYNVDPLKAVTLLLKLIYVNKYVWLPRSLFSNLMRSKCYYNIESFHILYIWHHWTHSIFILGHHKYLIWMEMDGSMCYVVWQIQNDHSNRVPDVLDIISNIGWNRLFVQQSCETDTRETSLMAQNEKNAKNKNKKDKKRFEIRFISLSLKMSGSL